MEVPPVKRRQFPTKQLATAEMFIKLEQTRASFLRAIGEAKQDPTKEERMRAWAAQYTIMENSNDLARLAIRTCGGQAMLENCVYDPASGQLVTGSYMDYCMPRADDLPSFNLGFTETPCPHNPLGVKGCGEAGAIAAPPALINAITDAIGVDIDMPATPEKVWRALQSRQHAAE